MAEDPRFSSEDSRFTEDPRFSADSEPSMNPTTLTGAKNLGLDTLGSIGKGLDYQRGQIAPFVGDLISKISGKQVYTPEEDEASLNPLNNKTFPTISTMLGRAGVPQGAQLSDYVPGYADPKNDNPWYQPEKGGMLDPSVRGTLGAAADVAIDPLTYETLGLGRLAKNKIAEDVVAQVGKSASPAETALKMSAPKAAPGALSMTGSALANANDSAIKPLLTPVSSLMGGTGRTLYDALLQPALAQGLKFGKENVSDILRKIGIWNPGNLTEDVGKGVGNLMTGRNAIAEQAAAQGAKPSIDVAMQPARSRVAELTARVNPQSQALAEQLQARIDQRTGMLRGEAPTPAKTIQTPSMILDESGRPIMNSQTVPGTPGKAAVQKSPLDMLNDTSDVYKEMSNNAFNSAVKTPPDIQSLKAEARGLNGEAMSSIGRASGSRAASSADQLNRAAGEMLSTKQGQLTSENTANRIANSIVSPTFSDKFAPMLAHSPSEIVRNALISKGMNAARWATMPTGYMLDKLSTSAAAPLVDSATRTYLKNKLLIGDQNGQE